MDRGRAIVSPDDLQQFLAAYPSMSTTPARGAELVLRGTFCYCGTPVGGERICDCYELEITVPSSFPRQMPSVLETGGRIERDADHHTFPDGALCLGSPLRLKIKLAENPTLVGFAENCLVPYLYAASRKLRRGGGYAFGELAHSKRGILDDYKVILGLPSDEQVITAIELLGMKRRIANKRPCPCGCGFRLGKCRLRLRLGKHRKIAGGFWFRQHAQFLRKGR